MEKFAMHYSINVYLRLIFQLFLLYICLEVYYKLFVPRTLMNHKVIPLFDKIFTW